MKKVKWLICAAIFLGLTAVKLFVPGAAAAISDSADRILGRDIDYRQAISYISQRMTEPREEPETAAPQAKALSRNSVEYAGAGRFSLVDIRQIQDELFAFRNAGKAVDEAAETEDEAEETAPAQEVQEEQEEQLPEAVTEFLESQEAFSSYSLPVNVSYDYYELPFDYVLPVGGRRSSGFGYRMHPIFNEVKFHYGTDIAANSGDSISAFADGTVTFAGYSDSYGNFITLEHADGWQSLYAHCSRLCVQAGDKVSAGQEIALVGATGNATGPHLHFELTENGKYFNPEYYVNQN